MHDAAPSQNPAQGPGSLTAPASEQARGMDEKDPVKAEGCCGLGVNTEPRGVAVNTQKLTQLPTELEMLSRRLQRIEDGLRNAHAVHVCYAPEECPVCVLYVSIMVERL